MKKNIQDLVYFFQNFNLEYSFTFASINMEAEEGGNNCSHQTSEDWRFVSLFHDGEREVVEPPPIVEKHSNQFHIGCYDGPARVRIKNATFLIRRVDGGRNIRRGLSVLCTPKANLQKLREQILQAKK